MEWRAEIFAQRRSSSMVPGEHSSMTDSASPADVRVFLLGGFSVVVDGQPVADRWRLHKAKTLVKILALTPRHRLHREQIVDMLWPAATVQAATNNLHQILHNVRRLMGANSIGLHDDVVRLCPIGTLTVDVDMFEQAAAKARTESDVTALRSALELWTGPLLPEDQYAGWATEHRERLAETHAALTTELASRLLELGDLPAALALLEPLESNRPLDEQLHRVLMEVLAGLGRRWDAIETYERLLAALDDAYAAEPEPQTRALYRHLLTGGKPMPSAVLHNLPAPTTSFVGRRRLLSELSTCLGRTRLLSLTGVGGVGKSRLAVELARLLGEGSDFPDGVWLVELAGIHDPEAVAATAASALQLTLRSGVSQPTAFAEQLASRTLLLIIDNCEHLLDACGELVDEVLAHCPNTTIVTTSREPLGVGGELVYRVPSLQLPSETEVDVHELARLEAVQLFVERARLSAPSFRLTNTTARSVAAICHRLDGIPLALELAAARLAHFTVTELAERLDDALALLRTGRVQRLDRQQTLAATLDWSYRLLQVEEQAIFRRLAVFAGGFVIDAAAAACDETVQTVIETISRLVDKSLVNADAVGSKMRYRLLEVVRQYAEARLADAGELPDCRSRHMQWYAAAAKAHDPDSGEPIVGEPSGWFDEEQENLRGALSAALATQPRLALELATASWRFWVSRGLIAEGARWLTLALDAYQDRSALRARALSGMSVLLIRQAKTTELGVISDEIIDLLDEYGAPDEQAHARHQQALMTFMAGNWEKAQTQIDDTLRVSVPFPSVTASAQHFAGILAMWRGEMAEARTRFDAALQALELVPDNTAPFFIAMSVGWVIDERMDPPLPVAEESILLGRRVGARQAIGHVRLAAALIERLTGRVGVALAVIEEALAGFRAVDDQYGVAYALGQQGHTLRWTARYAEADRCLEQSESLRRDLSDQRAVAISLASRAVTAASAGESDQARTLGREALTLMQRSSDTPGLMVATVNLAIAEFLSADLSAAQMWLDRGIRLFPIPGAQGALGWLYLLRAHVLRQLDDQPGAIASTAAAREAFAQLGERRGLDAVLSSGKEGLVSFST
jgi:predicted ATPase/DNA-binding SARP family transcriptional activator